MRGQALQTSGGGEFSRLCRSVGRLCRVETAAFGIQQRFRSVDLDIDSLCANVERLANIADEWKGIVAGYGQAETIARFQAIVADNADFFRA